MARREGYASLAPSARSRFPPQKLCQYFPDGIILRWNYSSAIALGALRQHEITHVRCAIVHTNLGVRWEDEAKFGQHRPRLTHSAGSVVGCFVPSRRDTQKHARVARTQRANDNVVHIGFIHDDPQLWHA